MVAIPMRLEDALRFNGYTIDRVESPAFDITLPEGVIHVPEMLLSQLTWRRTNTIQPQDSFYLQNLPIFEDAYRPVILSHFLDRYSTRRLSYNMPDQFGLAVRRWANLNLGPQSIFNRRYVSTAVVMPLTTQDASTHSSTTDKGRDAASDFPQSQLSGDTDYASFATDRSSTSVNDSTQNGRLGKSVMELLSEQRAAYLNVDEELLTAMDELFLTVWDRDERDPSPAAPMSAIGFLPRYC